MPCQRVSERALSSKAQKVKIWLWQDLGAKLGLESRVSGLGPLGSCFVVLEHIPTDG